MPNFKTSRRKIEIPESSAAGGEVGISKGYEKFGHRRTAGPGGRTCKAASTAGPPTRRAPFLSVAGRGRRHGRSRAEPYRARRHWSLSEQADPRLDEASAGT